MKTITLDSLKAFNELYGLKTSHPLIGVLDLKEATKIVNHIEMKFDVYALFLKNGSQCTLKYGRKSYDYQDGTIVSFCSGQVVELDEGKNELEPKIMVLMFQPDLIYGTPLASKIKDFEFFSFSPNESLHLSDKEREKFKFNLNLIREELERTIDSHTAAVLSAHIQLLLEHLDRFYYRQFITRHKVNSEIVSRFHQNLQNYFKENEIVSRSGASGGFQSTARRGALTFGATLVTLIFAWCSSPTDAGSFSNGAPGVRICLYVALFFAIVAGVFSLSRVKSISKTVNSA